MDISGNTGYGIKASVPTPGRYAAILKSLGKVKV